MDDISNDKVCFVIVKAREFDAKVPVEEPDPGSNSADDGEREILVDYADDATFEELKTFIDSLDRDEQCALIALTWVGRGTYSADEWREALQEAHDEANERAAEYLLGTPLLADYLEEGLSQFGEDCTGFEMGHL
ncbi:MAG TPA: DUF3775 domain-containing protein [Alphaproteobacteria bacterium]|nr:DUF3775 domain-containing protein [Alphaproteobacteria bacterium]